MMPYKSPFHPFLPARHSKWIFMGTVAATSGLLAWRRGFFTVDRPVQQERYQNRMYLPVRYESEFEPLAILPTPLLANFSVRNDPLCNRLTGALYRIVSDEEYRVSLVDVEADEPGVRELLTRYQVNNVPTIVALRTGIPIDSFTLKEGDEVDWDKLQQWVHNVAKDSTKKN